MQKIWTDILICAYVNCRIKNNNNNIYTNNYKKCLSERQNGMNILSYQKTNFYYLSNLQSTKYNIYIHI